MAYMAGVEIPDAEVHHHALVRLLAELGTNARQDARTIVDTIVTSDLGKISARNDSSDSQWHVSCHFRQMASSQKHNRTLKWY